MSGNIFLPKKAVVLRTGGLGDFILTVPLLVIMLEAKVQLTVVTRRSYYEILGEYCAQLSFMDVEKIFDSTGTESLRDNFSEATVFSFWKDRDGSLEGMLKSYGINNLITLDSRPNQPPHVVKRIFQDVGIQWKEKYYKRSWLQVDGLHGDCLWVHPGSGSSTKNLPVSWFVRRIRRWFSNGGKKVVVSFGEADLDVEEEFLEHCGKMPLEILHPSTFLELRQELITKAVLFIGNDSGPSHLASALGIRTEVGFIETNPAIWRPLGENVNLLSPCEV